MTISVQVFENGQLVKKQVPANDVEVEISGKKKTLGKFIDELLTDLAEKDKDLNDVKKYVSEVVKADVKWKNETNDVLKSILKRLDESEMI